jgi:hypothetical protein
MHGKLVLWSNIGGFVAMNVQAQGVAGLIVLCLTVLLMVSQIAVFCGILAFGWWLYQKLRDHTFGDDEDWRDSLRDDDE